MDAARLDVCGIDDFLGLLDCSEVTERAVDVLHIVVDGLGNSDDRDLELAALDFFDDGVGAALGAVATDGEQDIDAALLKEVDDDIGADRAARGTQQGATELVNAVDDLGVQPQRCGGSFGRKSRIAVANSQNCRDAVVVMQLKINGSDDIVQARTQATAGDDGNLGLGRFEEELLARAGPLEGSHRLAPAGYGSASHRE